MKKPTDKQRLDWLIDNQMKPKGLLMPGNGRWFTHDAIRAAYQLGAGDTNVAESIDHHIRKAKRKPKEA